MQNKYDGKDMKRILSPEEMNTLDAPTAEDLVAEKVQMEENETFIVNAKANLASAIDDLIISGHSDEQIAKVVLEAVEASNKKHRYIAEKKAAQEVIPVEKYEVRINTDSYKCRRCSKKNWEPGTRNDYMLAINGITRTLYSMREVMWQLELFRGNSFLESEYDENNKEENYHLSDRYVKFLQENTIKYYDRLCEFERTQYLSGYGFMQGYFDIHKVMEELKSKGSVKVPFKWLYDLRQYDKAMDGCYMEIRKVSENNDLVQNEVVHENMIISRKGD